MDMLTAFVVIGGATAITGYLIGKGDADAGTAILWLAGGIIVLAVLSGLVVPKTEGEPIQNAIAAIVANYGAPGAFGIIVGGVVGYYFGDKEKSAAKS